MPGLDQYRTGGSRPIIPSVKILWTAFSAVISQVLESVRNNQAYGITHYAHRQIGLWMLQPAGKFDFPY
jgi:hypothetical protein